MKHMWEAKDEEAAVVVEQNEEAMQPSSFPLIVDAWMWFDHKQLHASFLKLKESKIE